MGCDLQNQLFNLSDLLDGSRNVSRSIEVKFTIVFCDAVTPLMVELLHSIKVIDLAAVDGNVTRFSKGNSPILQASLLVTFVPTS